MFNILNLPGLTKISNIFYFSIFLLFIPLSSNAQQSLPLGIFPFSGEVTLRLTPSHKAQCTIKTSTKEKGDLFATRSSRVLTSEVFRSNKGELKYSTTVNIDSFNYFNITASIKKNGEFNFAEAEVKTNLSLPEADMDRLNKSIKQLSSAFSWALDKPLSNGATISQNNDFCNNLGLLFGLENVVSKQSNAGGFKVLGGVNISGRESILLSGSELLQCQFGSSSLAMQASGWIAIDRQSGQVAAGSISGKSDSNLTTEDYVCKVTGQSTDSDMPLPNQPTDESINERRLKELKNLMDKGLITREQYDLKSSEIIKAL